MREWWIIYNNAYNIDSVASLEPDLNSNRYPKGFTSIHVVEFSELEKARAELAEMKEQCEAVFGKRPEDIGYDIVRLTQERDRLAEELAVCRSENEAWLKFSSDEVLQKMKTKGIIK